MTMRKVVIFALVIALALTGLVFAHTAVSAVQDELLLFPTAELGDSSVLSGLTASMTFACGDHLRWHTDYLFGGEAQTTFDYIPKGVPQASYELRTTFDLFFTGGLSTSTTGSIDLRAGEYGDLVKAVAANTEAGGSRTETLVLSEYADFYMPDYELSYEDDEISCSESASLYGHLSGEDYYMPEGCYHTLLEKFRFPVLEGQTITVTVEKHPDGGISGISLSPENNPELFFLSDATSEGIWFLPVFRDEQGTPLPYESPQGHGIYFAPWKNTGSILRYADADKREVTPDLSKLRLVCPLDQELRIEDLHMGSGEAWLLTRDDAAYTLTGLDLTTGKTLLTLDVLPHDPALTEYTSSFRRLGDYLLVFAQGRLALVDAADGQLLLTAPEESQRFTAADFDPDTGCLRWDGETLILIDSTPYDHEVAFWVAAYTPGALRYYGEYSSSLLRGNDTFYGSYITLYQDPITIK